MNIVWHGSYALYFEDAREQFGHDYGLGYLDFFKNGCYAPLVELSFQYKKPLIYGQQAYVDILFRNVAAAKVIFDYEIHALDDDSLVATGSSVQVFLNSTIYYGLTHHSMKRGRKNTSCYDCNNRG